MFLRQSTTQTILFGPCLDITDGVTEETALTLAQADMRLSKDGGAFAQKNASGNATHDSDGWYNTSLNTTDTATIGELILNVHQPANMLPVWMRFYVVEEAIYDALFAASANVFEGAAGSNAVRLVTTTTTNTDVRGTDSAALASVCTEIRLAELDAGNLPTDIADIPTVAEFNARTLVAAAYFDPAADTVVNVTTVATLTGHIAQTGDSFVRLGAPIGASISADLADVPTVSEFNARTIASASYFDPAADTVVTVTNVTTVNGLAANVITAAAIATDAIGSDEFAASAAQKIRDEILPTQNVALSNIEFLFVAASDHVTPVTGATGTAVTRSIDGGAFGAGTGTLAEVANGIYQYDASAADMNGGVITFRFTGTGGTPGAPDDAFLTIVTGGGV